jgi:hypothetical protein
MTGTKHNRPALRLFLVGIGLVLVIAIAMTGRREGYILAALLLATLGILWF